MTLKKQIKEKKKDDWDLIKTKNFFIAKDHINTPTTKEMNMRMTLNKLQRSQTFPPQGNPKQYTSNTVLKNRAY